MLFMGFIDYREKKRPPGSGTWKWEERKNRVSFPTALILIEFNVVLALSSARDHSSAPLSGSLLNLPRLPFWGMNLPIWVLTVSLC